MSSHPGVPPTAAVRRAAVPANIFEKYESSRSSCAPGHAFSLFFSFWNKDWFPVIEKFHALRDAVGFGPAQRLAIALVERQRRSVQSLSPETMLIVDAVATSPFTTGLGIEHPVENGLAFLTPYGLPYLAGSGVKGVLRRAAEDAVLDGLLRKEDVELFFGTDNQSDDYASKSGEELRRGVLSFWDVFPMPSSNPGDNVRLCVELMTPHHSEYLQQGKSPHDSEQPNPIPFLALPAGSSFRFIVTCQTERIDDSRIRANWKSILQDRFAEAFAWLGFGAKTAVGYGAMKLSSRETNTGAAVAVAAEVPKCPWVDEAIGRLTRPGIQNVLWNQQLANEWKSLTDSALKADALADIRRRWGADWDAPRNPGQKKALAIYKGSS